MTKEEMLKDFMSKAPKEITNNVRLLDKVLPPLFDEDKTTFTSVISSAEKLEYDSSKVVIIATLPECEYYIRALSDRMTVVQMAVETIQNEMTVDCFLNELSFLHGNYVLDQSVMHSIIEKKEELCTYSSSCDRTSFVAACDSDAIFEKKYFESVYREEKGVPFSTVKDAILGDGMFPTEIMAVKNSKNLEEMKENKTL